MTTGTSYTDGNVNQTTQPAVNEFDDIEQMIPDYDSSDLSPNEHRATLDCEQDTLQNVLSHTDVTGSNSYDEGVAATRNSIIGRLHSEEIEEAFGNADIFPLSDLEEFSEEPNEP
ncbi:MAG: hypothetical protein K0S74_1292 [Chlamydiales bacterium]|jgi:hypothetical protein|nr:hypothetical protein [Chlamydiales bacterium]